MHRPRSRPLLLPVLVSALLLLSIPPDSWPTAAVHATGPLPSGSLPAESRLVASESTASVTNSTVQGPIGGRYYNVTTSLPRSGPGGYGVYSGAVVAVDSGSGIVFAVSQRHVLTAFGEGNGTLLGYRDFPLLDAVSSVAYDPVHARLWLGIDRPGGGNLIGLDPSTLGEVANVSTFPGLPGFEPYQMQFDALSQELFVDNSSMAYLTVNTTTDLAGPARACPVLAGNCPTGSFLVVDNASAPRVLVTLRTSAVYAMNATTGAFVYQSSPTGGVNFSLDALAGDAGTNDCVAAGTTGGPATFYSFNCEYGGAFNQGNFSGTIDSIAADPARHSFVLAFSGTNGSNVSVFAPSPFGGLPPSPVATVAVPAPPAELVLDLRTSTYLTGGTANGSTFALAESPLGLARTYPEFPAYRTAVVADPTDGVYLIADQAPFELSAYREGTDALLWQDPGAELGGFEVTSLAFDPQHDRVDAAIAGEPFIVVLDPSNGAALGAIALAAGEQPRWLSVDPTRAILYAGYTGPTGPGIWVVNTTSASRLVDLPLPGYFVGAMAADVADGSIDIAAYAVPLSNLTVISGTTYEVRARVALPVSAPPTALAIGSDGTAFVSYLGGSNVTVVPPLGNGAIGRYVLPNGEFANALAVDPALDLLYVSASTEPAAIDPIYAFNTSDGSMLGTLSVDGWSDAVAIDPRAHTLVMPFEYDGRIATVTEIPRPAAPEVTAVLPGNGSLEVAWQPPAGLVGYSTLGYNLSVATSAAGPWGPAGTVLGLNDTVRNLTDGREYFVGVAAITAGGEGPAAIGNGTPIGVPFPPTSVAVRANGSGSLDVAWDAPAVVDGAPVTHYTVEYQGGIGARSALNVGGVTHAALHGLAASTTYSVRVVAWNSAGSSDPSSNATGTTPAAGPVDVFSGLLPWAVGAAVVAGLGGIVVGLIARRRARARSPPPPTS